MFVSVFFALAVTTQNRYNMYPFFPWCAALLAMLCYERVHCSNDGCGFCSNNKTAGIYAEFFSGRGGVNFFLHIVLRCRHSCLIQLGSREKMLIQFKI